MDSTDGHGSKIEGSDGKEGEMSVVDEPSLDPEPHDILVTRTSIAMTHRFFICSPGDFPMLEFIPLSVSRIQESTGNDVWHPIGEHGNRKLDRALGVWAGDGDGSVTLWP